MILFMLIIQYIVQTTVFADEISYNIMEIGHSQQDRKVKVERFGSGSEAIVLLASIHGTEVIGTPLFNQLIDTLYEHPEWLNNRTLYLMKLTNPDGVVEGVRGNSENIDINRNFPTKNFGRGWFNGDAPLSAEETAILLDFFLEIQPSRVLTIHQPLNGIDYDGPAKELAHELSELTNIRT